MEDIRADTYRMLPTSVEQALVLIRLKVPLSIIDIVDVIPNSKLFSTWSDVSCIVLWREVRGSYSSRKENEQIKWEGK